MSSLMSFVELISWLSAKCHPDYQQYYQQYYQLYILHKIAVAIAENKKHVAGGFRARGFQTHQIGENLAAVAEIIFRNLLQCHTITKVERLKAPKVIDEVHHLLVMPYETEKAARYTEFHSQHCNAPEVLTACPPREVSPSEACSTLWWLPYH